MVLGGSEAFFSNLELLFMVAQMVLSDSEGFFSNPELL